MYQQQLYASTIIARAHSSELLLKEYSLQQMPLASLNLETLRNYRQTKGVFLT